MLAVASVLLLKILGAFLLLGIIVLVHEAGHFFAYRAFGVPIPRFAIFFSPGFGPIFRKSFWGTEFELGWLPLGGFVLLPDKNLEEQLSDREKEVFRANDPRVFDENYWIRNRPPIQKIVSAFAGPLANIVFASLLLFVLFWIQGTMPVPGPVKVESILPNSLASAQSLKVGDVISEINGKAITSPSEATLEIQVGIRAKQLSLKVNNSNLMVQFPAYDSPERLGIGLSPCETRKIESVPECASAAAGSLFENIGANYAVLGKLLTGRLSPKVMNGPVGIVALITKLIDQGVLTLLSLGISLNIGLAVMNLLPIPVLDGAHIIFGTLEWIRGKALSESTMNRLHYAGALILLSLFVFNSINDTSGLFSGK